MNINVRLNKNFTTAFNKMQDKYGEEFLKLQGLDDAKLSFTDFIDAFIDSDNVANASVDANSNISQKDIVTLTSEMSKPHKKLLAFNKIYYELNKEYGYKAANEINIYIVCTQRISINLEFLLCLKREYGFQITASFTFIVK